MDVFSKKYCIFAQHLIMYGQIMNFAVIAAGEGSRLVQEGVSTPKPLVRIGGVPLIERLLDMFVVQQPETISVIVNTKMPEVSLWLEHWKTEHEEVVLNIVKKDTPSSMHSLYELFSVLPDAPFVCTTVDTLFTKEDFSAYCQAFRASSSTCLFGLTSFVDDEKPLWVHVNDEGFICDFCDEGPAPFVSGGIYGLHKSLVSPVLNQCLSNGQARMRNFQRALLKSGVPVRAHLFGRVMDIDHRRDIEVAERWLGGEND